MLLIGVVTFVLCRCLGGPTYLFAFTTAGWCPAILLGLGAIWPRFNGRGALWARHGHHGCVHPAGPDQGVLPSAGVSGHPGPGGHPVAVIASCSASPAHGRPGWSVPTASNRKEVKLGELESRFWRCCASATTCPTRRPGLQTSAPPWRTWIRRLPGPCRHERLQVLHLYHHREGLAALPALSGKEAEMAEEF